MRVLIVPELYRPDDATANGTLNDAVVWVEQWLDIDESLHVYWLLAPPELADYDREYVLADRDRVTLVEAEPFMSGHEYEHVFTESGYTEAQLEALRAEIYDRYGYVDVVVDQLRRGRADLYKWLLLLTGHRAGTVVPFSVVANVHDLQLPFKYARTGYRNDFQRQTEISEAVLGEGMWFKASVDADGMREYGREFLRESVLDWAVDDAVMTGSPIDFSRFEETYGDRPEWLHVAGSIWDKKQTGVVMAVAERLAEEYGVRTVMTSMSKIPDAYADLPYVDAHSHASRRTFEDALRRGDLAVCATEYETLARTWFEQAASGQVLVVRDEPWIAETVPDDYRLAGDVTDLADLAAWAVEHWSEAVAENKRLLEHVRRVRSPERSGRRTYDDMVERVERTLAAYEPGEYDDLLARALDDYGEDELALDAVDELTAEYTDDGDRVTDQSAFSRGELVLALRTLGYEDTGAAGTPVFRRG